MTNNKELLSPSAVKTMDDGLFISQKPVLDFVKTMTNELANEKDLKFVQWFGNECLQRSDLRRFMQQRIALRHDITVVPIHKIIDGVKRFNLGLKSVSQYNFIYKRPSLKDRIKFFIFDLKDWWSTR